MSLFLDLFRSSEKIIGAKKPTVIPKRSETQKKDSGDAPKIRTIFMGTPEFSSTILDGLIKEHYNIISVVTKKDKPAGRSHAIVESAVKKIAVEHHIPILQPQKFDDPTIEALKQLKPDLIIVAAYGKILPKEVLGIPGFGCINVHASLLPLWRGASPIQNALLAGATETGITLILMNEGMDTGDILAQKKIAIMPDETQEMLRLRLTDLARDFLLEILPQWIARSLVPQPQNHAEATLCQLIEREDGHILWTDTAENIYNRFRALSPWPGIFSFWKKEDDLIRLKLHRISYQKQSPQTQHAIGQVFEVGEKIGVQTGNGIIFLEEVQLEGKTRLSVADFLQGNREIINSYLQ